MVLRGTLCLAGGIACYAFAGVFFRYAPVFVFRSFGLNEGWFLWIPFVALTIITISGCWSWKRGHGLQTYDDSPFHHDLYGDAETAGAFMVDRYARRVTGPAYVLSQIFLGGPLLLLRGLSHYKQRIANDPVLEHRLEETLRLLRSANKWQSINEYPDHQREIVLLARLKKIDFSAHKGTPRIKASPPDV